LAQAIRYALNHWKGLIRFLDDGRFELDTNIVERAMRPVALGCAFRRLQPSIPIEASPLFRTKPAGHSDDPSRVTMRVASG
jgi:hypothetical protein